MSEYSASYYERVRGELQAILFEVAPNLRPDTYQFVIEMLDANEFGVSLEVIVESLVEAGSPITIDVVNRLSHLSDEMKMDYDVKGPLTGLVR